MVAAFAGQVDGEVPSGPLIRRAQPHQGMVSLSNKPRVMGEAEVVSVIRRGARAYLAAYDVHCGQVFGRCEDTTGINLDAIIDRLNAFEDRYNQTPRLFTWKFNTTDLDELPTRLEHNPIQPRAA